MTFEKDAKLARYIFIVDGVDQSSSLLHTMLSMLAGAPSQQFYWVTNEKSMSNFFLIPSIQKWQITKVSSLKFESLIDFYLDAINKISKYLNSDSFISHSSWK